LKIDTAQFWNKNALSKPAFLALTIWVAHFFQFRGFGLYEDDYAFVSPSFGWNWNDLLIRTASDFSTWPQGRPLGFFLPHFFSFVGFQLGGLDGIYMIAFFIITLNACLFYALIKRVGQGSTAFIGALAFCLFPADTTHSFLMHALGLQTSITFLLIASHHYLSGKRVLPYLLILCALLTYESPFMVFWGAPLLVSETKWDNSFKKELIRHIAILTGITLLIVVIRIFLGEGRITEAGSSVINFVEIPAKIGKSIFIGPIVSLKSFFYGPLRTLLHWNSQLSIVYVLCLGAFIWVFHQLDFDHSDEKRDHQMAFRSKVITYNGTLQAPSAYSGIAKLLLAGVIMLGLAFVLSFTHYPPTTLYGRATSVHLAAAFGAALIFACVCSILVSVANAYRLKIYAIVILALYFSLVVSYRFAIQLDFKHAWQNERSFWTSAIKDFPDMTDKTVIFVLDHDLSQTRYIETNSWADPIMLQQIFQFPGSWETPPRLFVVRNNWTKRLILQGNQFIWEVPPATWRPHREVLPNSNVILLEMENGMLVRRFGSINISGQDLELKPMPLDAKLNLVKGPLYDYLINEESHQSSR